MNSVNLSIIIPIKVTFQNRFLLNRATKLIQYFSNFNDIEVILVDSSQKGKYSKVLKSLCIEECTSYYFLEMQDIYSAAKARNYGAKQAKGEYLLFYDVDLVVKDDFIENVLQDINELSEKAFAIYPCLYLSESKTKLIEGEKLDNQVFEDIKIRYLKGFNDEVLYLAVNTSTILVQKNHFFYIGAYNELFKGHGYEDFELIHRLYKFSIQKKLPKDYTIDYKTPFPAEYKGFRQYYAFVSLPNLFNQRFTLHLWHPRPLSKKYYRNRTNNFNEFLNIISKDINMSNISAKTNEYKEFIFNLLQTYGYNDIETYCGLFKLNKYSSQNQKKNIYHEKSKKIIFKSI